VHGLGIDPADGALFIATHTGLFRSPEGSTSAVRVGSSSQDTMGFTVAGPGHFFGSGHPGAGEAGPPNLGLIESTDAGESWEAVSLGGQADFHVLRYASDRIYAFDGLSGLILVSGDGGRTWQQRRPPAPVIDLAIDPTDPRRIIIATERGLAVSADEGASWQALGSDVGLLAWPRTERLYLIDATGQVQLSDDGGKRWAREVGSIRGQPTALVAPAGETLYAALVDGTVLGSSDGGASWQVRSSQ